jgi:hypothetical protein
MEPNTFELPFIKSITVSKLAYPLYDSSELFYDVGEKAIYKRRQKLAYPTALDVSAEFSVELDFALGVDWISEECRLTATLNGATLFDTTIRRGDFRLSEIRYTLPTIIKPVLKRLMVDGELKALPWLFEGKLKWVFNDPNGGRYRHYEQYATETPIELYFFPPNLASFFQKGGIPLPLLRSDFLPMWMKISSLEQIPLTPFSNRHPIPQNIELSWASFAVHALFSESDLIYEKWRGSYRYLSFGAQSIQNLFLTGRGFDCWLELWLEENCGSRLSHLKKLVNCYDLAALCQIIVALGVDTHYQDLRLKYMEPFGFIKPTHLIGRFEEKGNNPQNLCNNPFYGDSRSGNTDRSMLCDADSPNQSGFGNHMFLTLGPKMAVPNVLDACCGPQLGTVSIINYPQAVIDTTTLLYRLGATAPGGLADILDGPGVEELLFCRPLNRSPEAGAQRRTLFDFVAAAFQNEGKLLDTQVRVLADARCITAKWKLVKPPLPGQPEYLPWSDTIDIEVYKYNNLDYMRHDFALQVSESSSWDTSAVGGLGRTKHHSGYTFSPLVSGSIRMFKDEGNLYIATIETLKAGLSKTVTLKQGLESILSNAFAGRDYRYNQDLSIIGIQPPGMSHPVGTKITISLQVCLCLP